MTSETQPRELTVTIDLDGFSPPEQNSIINLVSLANSESLARLTPPEIRGRAGNSLSLIIKIIDKLLIESQNQKTPDPKINGWNIAACHLEPFIERYDQVVRFMKAHPYQIAPEILGLFNQGIRGALSSITGKDCREGRIALSLQLLTKNSRC